MNDKALLQQRRDESRKKIIDATVALISRDGINALTIRNVCKEAGVTNGSFYHVFSDKDDLLASFVIIETFQDVELAAPASDPAARVSELYAHLVGRYLDFGQDFMRGFYKPDNTALSSYMGQTDGAFAPGTVMARAEQEIADAISAGYLPAELDAHATSEHVCTMVKGAVFEYCLSGGASDPLQVIDHLIKTYFAGLKATAAKE